MKKYKILIVLVVVFVLAGISLAFANGNLQGMIFNFKNPNTKTDVSRNAKDYCNKKKFKVASVLLSKDVNQILQDSLDKANLYKDLTPEAFKTATGGLATMDTSAPLVIMQTKDGMVNEFGQFTHPEILTSNFYKTNTDDYDFIIVFVDFTYPGVASNHSTVTKQIEGIGMGILNRASLFGSKGKLKGVIEMYDDWKGSWPNNMTHMVTNVILHEIGHQWAVGEVGDLFSGDRGDKLQIRSDYSGHYYGGVSSPSNIPDPLYGGRFVSNGDGTFSREAYTGKTQYNPFTLYFMGLLSKKEYATKYQIYKAGPGEDWSKAVPYIQVSVNDIIAVMGERKCK